MDRLGAEVGIPIRAELSERRQAWSEGVWLRGQEIDVVALPHELTSSLSETRGASPYPRASYACAPSYDGWFWWSDACSCHWTTYATRSGWRPLSGVCRSSSAPCGRWGPFSCRWCLQWVRDL